MLWKEKKKIVASFFILALVFLLLNNYMVQGFTTSYFNQDDYKTTCNSNTLKEYYSNCSKIGQYDNNYGQPNDVFVEKRIRKTYAYLADGWGGLVILDVTTPNNPLVIAHYINTSEVKSVYVLGKIAYVVHRSGMLIFDVKNPSNPDLLGTFLGLSDPVDIIVNDNLAFIADAITGLVIVDVSNLKNPYEVNRYKSGILGYSSLSIHNNILFVVGYDFEILDVNDVMNIVTLSSYDIGNSILSGLFVYRELAIIGEHDETIILDISDLSNPKEIFNIENDVWIIECYIRNDILYLLSMSSGLYFFDITDLYQIEQVGWHELIGYYPNGFFSDNILYLVNGYTGIEIFEISESHIDIQFIGHFIDGGSANEVYLENSVAYLTNGYNGLAVIDVENPGEPKLLGNHFYGQSYFYNIFVKDFLIYVARNHNSATDIYNISNPLDPILLTPESEYKYQYVELEFAIKDSIIYYLIYLPSGLGYDSTALIALNLTDISNITTIYQQHYFNEQIRDMQIVKDTLFLASSNGLYILNCSNPNTLTTISTFTTSYNHIWSLSVNDNYVYMSVHEFGLRILDISNLSNPIIVGTYELLYDMRNNRKTCIAYENELVYLTDNARGLLIFNVSDVSQPKIIGQFYEVTNNRYDEDHEYGYNLQDILVKNNIVYIAAELDGLIIIQLDGLSQQTINVQSNPVVVSSFFLFVIIIVKRRKKNKQKSTYIFIPIS